MMLCSKRRSILNLVRIEKIIHAMTDLKSRFFYIVRDKVECMFNYLNVRVKYLEQHLINKQHLTNFKRNVLYFKF